MKIAFVIEHFSASKGGGEGYARMLARAVVAAGNSLDIFSASYEDPGCPVTYHAMPNGGPIRSLRETLFDRAVTKELSVGGFDIVQTFGRTSISDVARPGGGCHRAWMHADLKSFHPLVRIFKHFSRALSVHTRNLIKLEERCYENTSRIIAVSGMVKRHLTDYYPEIANKIEVIHNGVELERFDLEKLAGMRSSMRDMFGVSGEVAVLFVANNFRLKGLQTLIEAMGKSKTNFVLLVAGKGDHTGHLKRLAAKRGVRAKFLGASANMERLYAACDIVAHPTFYDPFSNVTLEAMAAGRPFITTTMNGAYEIITHGEDGLVMNEPGLVDELAEYLQELSSEERRRAMGRLARETAEKYPASENARKALELYQQIYLDRHPPEPPHEEPVPEEKLTSAQAENQSPVPNAPDLNKTPDTPDRGETE